MVQDLLQEDALTLANSIQTKDNSGCYVSVYLLTLAVNENSSRINKLQLEWRITFASAAEIRILPLTWTLLGTNPMLSN